MVMNFISYKLCELSVCLMCFQMFFACINDFLQFIPFLLGLFKSVKEGFYCSFIQMIVFLRTQKKRLVCLRGCVIFGYILYGLTIPQIKQQFITGLE
jgi:hypothetical protein